MAQAVPPPPVVPCLELNPAGWSLNDVKVVGVASVVFDIDEPFQEAAVTGRRAQPRPATWPGRPRSAPSRRGQGATCGSSATPPGSR